MIFASSFLALLRFQEACHLILPTLLLAGAYSSPVNPDNRACRLQGKFPEKVLEERLPTTCQTWSLCQFRCRPHVLFLRVSNPLSTRPSFAHSDACKTFWHLFSVVTHVGTCVKWTEVAQTFDTTLCREDSDRLRISFEPKASRPKRRLASLCTTPPDFAR